MKPHFVQTPPPASLPPLPEYLRTWAGPEWRRYFVRTAVLAVLAVDQLNEGRTSRSTLHGRWFEVGRRLGRMQGHRLEPDIEPMLREYVRALRDKASQAARPDNLRDSNL